MQRLRGVAEAWLENPSLDRAGGLALLDRRLSTVGFTLQALSADANRNGTIVALAGMKALRISDGPLGVLTLEQRLAWEVKGRRAMRWLHVDRVFPLQAATRGTHVCPKASPRETVFP